MGKDLYEQQGGNAHVAVVARKHERCGGLAVGLVGVGAAAKQQPDAFEMAERRCAQQRSLLERPGGGQVGLGAAIK